jgi:hypothetical protein
VFKKEKHQNQAEHVVILRIIKMQQLQQISNHAAININICWLLDSEIKVPRASLQVHMDFHVLCVPKRTLLFISPMVCIGIGLIKKHSVSLVTRGLL